MTAAPVHRPFTHITRALLIGLLSIAMAIVTLAGPVPAAHAVTIVTDEDGLRGELLKGSSPLELGTSFTVAGDDLTISANTTIELGNRTLQTKNIIVDPGVTLTIAAAGAQGALTVRASDGQGPGIKTTDATLVINSGIINVTSISGHAGIGGAEGSGGGPGGAGGTTEINGGKVTVTGGGAGIGGGQGGFTSAGGGAIGGNGGNGGHTEINGGSVNAEGNFGAGIGGGSGGLGSGSFSGGLGGNGGDTTINNATVRASGTFGAGIGGGQGGTTTRTGWNSGFGGNGGTTTIDGGTVSAEGSAGAGVGGGKGGVSLKAFGGFGGHGGTTIVRSGQLTASGTDGAGIGGGDAGWGMEGDGFQGLAATVLIGAGASVTPSRSVDSAVRSGEFVAIGSGKGHIDAAEPLPPTQVDGEIVLPAGQHLRVSNNHTISGTGTIIGEGTIHNFGIITPHVHDDVEVEGNNYYVTFDSGSSQVDPRTQVVRVLAKTFASGHRSFPANPVITDNPFLGWNTKADGTGTEPTMTTTLTTDPTTFYGQWTYDTYELTPDVTDPDVGDPVTFAVTVEDGDPGGDQSGGFTFSTDAPSTGFTGNEVVFTEPGDWTVTAIHKTTPTIVLTAPITVTTDRTAADRIALSLSATTLDVDGTITATVTGTDAWDNPLGDLTDLATISSDESGDTITQGSVGTPGSIHFATPGIRTITASIGSVTDTVDVTVTAEDYTMAADVTSPLAGDEVTFAITADDGNPAGNLASEFTFETNGPGTTTTGNPVTLTTAGNWTVTATHTTSGTQVTLPLTVGTDRDTPAAITVTLDRASATVGDEVAATVTGTDTYGNALGDLTDLATITSNYPSDVIDADGNLHVLAPGTHLISADIGGIRATASVDVLPTTAYYTMTPDATAPLAGETVTYTITADNGIPTGDLASAFTLTTDSAGAAVSANAITFTTAGDATVTATHDAYGTVLTLPVTVTTDRTTPADITLNLSSTSVDVGGTTTFDISGTDAWGNPLGDLTDLATITSDHPSDVIDPSGSIRFPTASPHVITATIGSVSHSITVTVIPALPSDLAGTGGEPLPLVLAGGLLLLLGGVLVARRQRRS